MQLVAIPLAFLRRFMDFFIQMLTHIRRVMFSRRSDEIPESKLRSRCVLVLCNIGTTIFLIRYTCHKPYHQHVH